MIHILIKLCIGLKFDPFFPIKSIMKRVGSAVKSNCYSCKGPMFYFPKPIWWLTNIHNTNARGSDTLF